ncbi:MAG: hypothetical protein NC084_08330 [Bacteroides sp.]|nr:hypothetical protein [Eubacterium sp.]MCM1418649.1 hypothetical protein [Roseburia sp.]MCM1462703.1 hypothetical protein [Bacteroides sp.]
MKKFKIFAAILSAAIVSASALTVPAFADPAQANALDSEAKDDAQTPSGYWAVEERLEGIWRKTRPLTKSEISNYTGWAWSKSNDAYYFVKGVKQIKPSKVIDGVRYTFTETGVSKGTYSGWTDSAKGRRYWYDGIVQKNKWLRSSDGRFYYADENGYMAVGWSDVTRIGGAYSYFDEKGVWDGKVYWSKSAPEATRENMLNETVRIRIKPVETVLDSDKNRSKKEKQYLESNSTYELEIPLAVAETLRVGDTVLLNPKVTRGEKKNGVYDYYLTIGSDDYAPEDRDNSGVFDEEEIFWMLDARLGLFNKLLLIRDDKLMLDRMFRILGLSWEEIGESEELIRSFEDLHDGIWCWSGETTYGLFGGYNRLDEETGEYVYRDGMSEKELIDLMKRVSAESKAKREADEREEGDYDYYDWFTRASAPGLWLKAEIEEIPSVS